VHKAAARHAARANIRLAVEPLNRFECYALNTVAAAAEIARRVDEPNYGVLYDTFHTNIEEKDPVGEYTRHRPVISHVHLSENDRGTPGKGHVPWDAVLGTIKRSGYDQWFVIEAFGRSLPGIAAATKVWRDFFPDPDEVVKFGHDFLRRTWVEA
jgi:D-psicose/D-tagatose/L-ribulose 3-epimerase